MRKNKLAASSSNRQDNGNQETATMKLPLFPLNLVLFPGMVLPLHIFEPRYRAMINYCIEEKRPFGVVLIDENEHGRGDVAPYRVGTAARIERVEKLEDGRMNITAVGMERFRVQELHYDHSYLTGTVAHFPVVNGSTKSAADLSHQIRPRILEYVELLAKASNVELHLDRLPEDPTTLAYLIGIALQVGNEQKQKVLALPGIPEMLAREKYLLSREILLLKYMVDTQAQVEEMNTGPTGCIFPN